MRSAIFRESASGSIQVPRPDIILPLDDLFGSINEDVDRMASQVYGTLTGAKVPVKPFVVGFIPPDVQINHIPIERSKVNIATATGSTASGQSGSAGASGPRELAPTVTLFTRKALGNAIYKDLRRRNMSDADARRLTPLLVGQVGTEILWDKNGVFRTKCFNLGNAHSKGPGQGGYYYKGKDSWGNSNKEYRKGKDNSYTTYFRGATSLEDGAHEFINVTFSWKYAKNATTGNELAKALRPDVFPESRGGNNGQYFGAGATPEEIYAGYGRSVQLGADIYRRTNPDPSQPDPNGIISGGSVQQPGESDAAGNSVDFMGDSGVTTMEEDDPLASRTGRNIRLADVPRLEIVDAQVRSLQRQALAVRSIPALYMLINPQSFTRGREFSVDTVKARRRNIVHMWFEKPMTITGKGVTAAQYILDSGGSGGLTNSNRNQSLSYRNLMSLVRTYKNNGWLYSGEESGQGNDGIPLIAMSVYMYFDGHVYIGSFDDFSVSDTGDKPYNLSYSFKFTVAYSMATASVTDSEVTRSIGGRG